MAKAAAPAPVSGAEILLYGALVFGPLAFGCVETWSLAILQCALFALPWARGAAADSPAASPARRTILPALAAVILLGLLQRLRPGSLLWPELPPVLTVSPGDTNRALLLWAAYASLLWSAPRALRGSASLTRMTWAIFGIGLAVSAIGILQTIQGNRYLYGLREVGILYHPFGPYYNRNHAASLMLMSALAGLGLFFARLARWEGEPSVNRLSEFAAKQGLFLALVGVVVLGVLLTGSRSALHILCACSGLGVFLSSGRISDRQTRRAVRGGLFALATAGYLLFVLSHPKYLGRIDDSLNSSVDGSLAYRLSMYRSGLKMFLDRPWTGFGLGTFERAFPFYQERLLHARVEHAHCDWLELLLQTGLFGFLAYAAGLSLLLGRAFKAWRDCRRPGLRELAAWNACAVVSFLLHGFTEFNFQVPANAVVFFLLLSWLGAFILAAERRQALPSDAPSPAPRGPVLALAASLVLSALALRPLVAEGYAAAAARAAPADAPGLLERAFAWDPRPETLDLESSAYQALADGAPAAARQWLLKAQDLSLAALQADPADAVIRRHYGVVLQRLGRAEDARLFTAR